MNASWPRFLKSLYRRDPIPSFAVTIGAVDAVIGGLNGRPSLLAFGVSLAAIAFLLRWWQAQRKPLHQAAEAPPPPMRVLPERSSRPQLPMLNISRKHPPYS